MRSTRTRLFAIIGLLCLALVATASPIAAAPGGNGNGNGQGGTTGNGGSSLLQATPELDSLVLFGAGAAGMAAYVLVRRRASRRRDSDPR
ncbi:MAG TPA: hypothetical protein VF937_13090 [Chloroflexota bacterium]